MSTSSTDAAGNSVDGLVVAVVTPGPGVANQGRTSFNRGTITGLATIDTTGLGGVTLSGADGQRWTGTFTSDVMDAQAMVDWERVSIQAEILDGARLTFRVRTGGHIHAGRRVVVVEAGGRRQTGRRSRLGIHPVPGRSRGQGQGQRPDVRSIGFGHNGTLLQMPNETR